MVGDYDMPFIYAQDVTVCDIELISFSNLRFNDNSASAKDKSVHFFIDDYKFDEVWNNPEKQLQKLAQYRQLLSPGFSVYSNMPEAMQIYNTFRNRWCAAFWQRNKLTVIPTVVWGADNTFDFCFDGIEEGSIVAVSTIGTNDDYMAFISGFRRMCEVIKPKSVLNYGKMLSNLSDYAEIISVPYKHPSHVDGD
jgi:hypothetical protein